MSTDFKKCISLLKTHEMLRIRNWRETIKLNTLSYTHVVKNE